MAAALDPLEQCALVSSQRDKAASTTRKCRPEDFHRPRRFTRVPTHAIAGVAEERRRSPRAPLCLPLRLTQVDGRQEPIPVTLVTKNISSSGVYFLAPRWLEPGTAIEMEVGLVGRPIGQGNVRMCTAAHIVRVDPVETPGWRGYAASFDDITFDRDDTIPLRFVGP
jgi:hypothetical protein